MRSLKIKKKSIFRRIDYKHILLRLLIDSHCFWYCKKKNQFNFLKSSNYNENQKKGNEKKVMKYAQSECISIPKNNKLKKNRFVWCKYDDIFKKQIINLSSL